MNQRSTRLKNSLKSLDLSDQDLEKIISWYEEIRANDIVFPIELATKKKFGVSLAQKILLTLSLKKLMEPFTLPKANSNLYRQFARKGYELIVSDKLIEEVRSRGLNPSEIKAVTGFKKCASR